MTIKAFAILCGCSAQTLRYYDHVDLLKPVRVDPWSGYRYYDQSQALSFVKIKNLQRAGFAISEIKELLTKDQAEVYEAFSRKIAEQERMLSAIKEIQRSYQREMDEMEARIGQVREYISQAMDSYDPQEEFGIDQESYQAITHRVDDFFDSMTAEEKEGMAYKLSSDDEDEKEIPVQEFLQDPAYEVLLENHGWDHVKEFLDQLETPRKETSTCSISKSPRKRPTKRPSPTPLWAC